MGNVLSFKAENRQTTATLPRELQGTCEIVIFPGVRIERQPHDADAGDPSPRGNLDGTGGRRRSRKTS